MAQSISGAITRIQALVLTISGVKAAPTNLPGQMAQFPYAIIYQGAGNWTTEAALTKRFEGELVLELHVPFADLARSSAALAGYVESVVNELAGDPTLNATVATIQWPVRFDGLVARNYGGTDTLAYVWHIPIRMVNAVS